ncbi:LysR family transcriptional regulator [Agrilactobacillus composti DSM 18527 = JCM 14202]|uniref:LysR family transcriptional regulator n=2 Tax=Agrilactobacillus TaxID=2767875 RepID=A0A0R1XK51_9LACO|nr:LysR family transcriptional regulator [Agrilactobacillus composti DSM 18527 = JCM 14202]
MPMNLQQMRYVLAVVDNQSFRAAAKKLYITQPTLSHSISELEKELNTELFKRTTQGNFLTPAGTEFVQQARRILQAVSGLSNTFTNKAEQDRHFSIAGQHYDFIAAALTRILPKYPDYQYLRVFESTTLNAIRDVAQYRSEIGILFINDGNQSRLLMLFDQNKLIFEELGTFETHIFLSTHHPLAEKEALTLEDLAPYPQVRFTQDTAYSEIAEDPLDPPTTGAVIATSDRATLSKIVSQTDAYGSGSGILTDPEKQGLTLRPLIPATKNRMILLKHPDQGLSPIATDFVTALKTFFPKSPDRK